MRGVELSMIVVNPNHKNASPMAAIEPPIWCAYLATLYGADEILDAETEGLSILETVQRVGESQSLIVAMGANPSASSTPKADIALELSAHLRDSDVVGLHFGNMPDVSGLKPRWDLIDFSKYRAHNWHCLDGRSREGYAVVYTSFGCPFYCSYCNIHALYNTRKVVFREPKEVVDEIGTLVETHSVRNLKVCDELFVLNPNHVNNICDLLIERDYDLNIWAYARVDTVNETLLKKMKKAGFNWLCYGFEASSLLGDKYEAGKAFKARAMTRDAGINVIGNFMFGLPNETMADMWNTKNLASELHCEYVNFYVALPYPGSEWYDSLKDKPTDWSSYDQFAENICADPEVVRFRDKAFREYFSDYDYQRMIKNKFGANALEHIGEMLQWKPREIISSGSSLK